MKHSLALVLFLAVLGLAAAASADITDFAFGDQIKLAGQLGRLAVTPDDRFVLVLQPAAKAIAVVDTWDFSLVSGSISLSNTPVAIAISPIGDNAYITLRDGKVDVVDISALPDLGLNDSLTALTPQPAVSDTVKISSNALGDIAITNLKGSFSEHCIFVIDGHTIGWFKESTHGTPGAFTISNCSPKELEGGGPGYISMDAYLFVLCDNAVSGKATLEQFECQVGGPVDMGASLLLGDQGNFLGLSLSPNFGYLGSYGWLLVGETVNKNLVLIDALPNVSILDSLTVSISMKQVLATDFASDDSIAFVLNDADLILAQMNGTPSAFTGNTVNIALPTAGGGYLARSSASDQYVYLSLAGGDTMAVVTANPWVTITGVNPGGTVTGGDTITISFKSEPIYSYALKLASGFKTGTTLKTGSVSTGLAVGATVAVSKLSQGMNVLEVDATVGTRTGRNAVAVNVNLAPVPQNFSLDFGTNRLIIRFTVQNRKYLDHMEIYYGDTLCSTALDGYTLIDANTVDGGKPPSPITISSPTAGQDIQKVVEGVQNGKTYCVQIVTFDTLGRSSLGVRKSVRVEKAFTLTELTGEKGGFACFGLAPSGVGFRGSGAWLVVLPWLGLWLARIQRKWRRGR